MKPEKIVSINTQKDPSAAFDRVMRGVDLLANAVKITLGPYGRNFLLENSGSRISNDGVSVAKEISSHDEIEELGIRVVREVATKTNEDAGDGTTTATTLAQAIIHQCSLYMAHGTQFAKKSVMALRQQIDYEAEQALALLAAQATPIETREQLIEVARVAVEDEQMAELIGGAQFDLGPDGIVIAEETTEPVCSVERIQGIRIDNGLGTSMVMNDQEKQRLVVDDVYVLLTNYTIQSLADIKAGLDAIIIGKGVRQIVIIARAFSQEAIREIMENHKQGIMLYPMNAPYVNQREVMKDIASVLGGRYIHDEDSTLDSITEQDFGFAKKVIGYRYSAIFTGSDTEKTLMRMSDRVEILRKEHEGAQSKFDKKAIEQRISQLTNGFALLKIGSISDTDRKYKFDKAEDAVNTVRSAYQEGTVPGAGVAFVNVAEQLSEDSILRKALMAPYRQIMENAGEEFDIETWVRNSLKVDRVALQNACRIASDLITIGGAVATEKIKPIDQLLRTNQTND